MFDVDNRHFTICTWTDVGINIGEQDPNGKGGEVFKYSEELLNGFMISGICLGDLANKVIITDYTSNGRAESAERE